VGAALGAMLPGHASDEGPGADQTIASRVSDGVVNLASCQTGASAAGLAASR
jgi:hypothetical protein